MRNTIMFWLNSKTKEELKELVWKLHCENMELKYPELEVEE